MNGECKYIPISSSWTIDDSIPFTNGGWASWNIPTSKAEIIQNLSLT